MFSMIFFTIVGGALALLVLNVYYRAKVLKSYKYLVEHRVEFSTKHFLQDRLMEQEVIARHPEHAHEIRTFVRLIKRSVTVASGIILFILSLGYLLMRGI